MNRFVKSIPGALALLAIAGCTTIEQLADEGRLQEASQGVDLTDQGEYAHVARAVAREVEAEVVLCPLDDAEVFAALGFVPERFASEDAVLAYWRLQAGRHPGDRLEVTLQVTGYLESVSFADVVQGPSPPPGGTSGDSSPSTVVGHLGAAIVDWFAPGLRQAFSGGSSWVPDPDAADVQRRALAVRRLEHLRSLGESTGPRQWGFLVFTSAPRETVGVDSRLWVEWANITSPTYHPPRVEAPSEGTVRERLRALSERGPLVLRSSDMPAWEIDTTRATEVTDEVRRAIRLTADPESYFDRGLVLAHADHRPEAANDFARALELGGPGAVYYALWGVAMGLPASTLEPHTTAPWPGPVGRLFLGQTTFEQLLAEAQAAPDERDRRGRECEAHCYAALLAELNGDLASARTHYEAAVETGRTDFIEHRWATARLVKR